MWCNSFHRECLRPCLGLINQWLAFSTSDTMACLGPWQAGMSLMGTSAGMCKRVAARVGGMPGDLCEAASGFWCTILLDDGVAVQLECLCGLGALHSALIPCSPLHVGYQRNARCTFIGCPVWLIVAWVWQWLEMHLVLNPGKCTMVANQCRYFCLCVLVAHITHASKIP